MNIITKSYEKLLCRRLQYLFRNFGTSILPHFKSHLELLSVNTHVSKTRNLTFNHSIKICRRVVNAVLLR